jgi:polyisoprenyl-teichoic acid--peptidoglycan teichoic acid transferase
LSHTKQGKTRGHAAHSQGTRPNTRPNPVTQYRPPEPTYRARPASHTAPAKIAPLAAQVATARVQGQARQRRLRLVVVLLCVMGVAVTGVAIFLSQQVFTTVQTVGNALQTVISTPVGQRFVPQTQPGTPDDQATPVITVVTQALPDWSKQEPINILLLGLDYRPQEEDTRADTQIVVHIDPKTASASMLSIPRDLWVPIPGYGEDRINSAYQRGDHMERTAPGSMPGGGPTLAMSTVQDDFGVKIDYYAQVDFSGFEKVVDALGGLNIDVPRPLVDNDYPLAQSSYGSTRIYVPAGLQHMDGHTALEYARSRHTDSDLGRNSRQQQVLLALKQQGMNFNLLLKLNDIATQLSSAVHTDLSLQDLYNLAQLSRQIKPENITTCQIDETMATQTILPSGANVLMPNWPLINARVSNCFADPELIKEAARLSVKNGTLTAGMGRKVSTLLQAKGLNIVDLSSTEDQGKHPTTTVIDYTGGQKPRTLEVIKSALGMPNMQVQQGDPAQAPLATQTDGKPVDILVIAGDDRIDKSKK